jgi:hypothetical protein
MRRFVLKTHRVFVSPVQLLTPSSTPPAGPRPPPVLATATGGKAENPVGRIGAVDDLSGTSANCPEQTVRHASGHNSAGEPAPVSAGLASPARLIAKPTADVGTRIEKEGV